MNRHLESTTSIVSLLRPHKFDQMKVVIVAVLSMYSKTCVKRPLKNRQNEALFDKW